MQGESSTARKRREELELIRHVAATTKHAVLTGPAGSRARNLSTHGWVTKADLVMPGKSKGWGNKRTYDDRIYRSGDISGTGWSLVNGMRVAAGIQCLYDSYRYYGRTEALVQIESARSTLHLTTEQLLERAEALPSGRGIRAFRELLAYAGDLSFSPLETLKRDAILRAINEGRLTGVETLEYQVGFNITDRFGEQTVAWADFLINGSIIGEADGRVKKDGSFGDAVTVTLDERHREVMLQNEGAQFVRTGWFDSEAKFIGQLQRRIDMRPGVVQLPNRRNETYREYLARIERRAAG